MRRRNRERRRSLRPAADAAIQETEAGPR
jgi:hypothetical protein